MTKVEGIAKFYPSNVIVSTDDTTFHFERWSIVFKLDNGHKVFLDTSSFSVVYKAQGNIGDRLKFEGINSAIPCVDPGTGQSTYIKTRGSAYLLILDTIEDYLREGREISNEPSIPAVAKSPLDEGKYTLEQLSDSMRIPIELNYIHYEISPQERERAINYALDNKDFDLLKSLSELKVKGEKVKYIVKQGVLKPYWEED